MQCKDQVLIKFQIVQRRKYVSRLVLDFLESGLTYPHEKTTVFGFQPNARSTCTNAPFPTRIRENESSFSNVREINILFLHQPFASTKPQARPRSWISKVPPTIQMPQIFTSQAQRTKSRGHLKQSASQMVELKKKLVTTSYRIQQSTNHGRVLQMVSKLLKILRKSKIARVSCNYLDGKMTRKPNWMTSNRLLIISSF